MDPPARRAAKSREALETHEEIALAWVCGPLPPAPEPGPRQNIAPRKAFFPPAARAPNLKAKIISKNSNAEIPGRFLPNKK